MLPTQNYNHPHLLPRDQVYHSSPSLYTGIAVFVFVILLVVLAYSYIARPGPFQIVRRWLRLPARTRTAISHYPVEAGVEVGVGVGVSQQRTQSPCSGAMEPTAIPVLPPTDCGSGQVLHSVPLVDRGHGAISDLSESSAAVSCQEQSGIGLRGREAGEQ